MRKLTVAAATTLVVALLGVAVLVLTGTVTLVTTDGVSMEPRLHAGDLVAVTPRDSYAVGDAVAYHSDELGTTVLHRVVAISGGRYVFQGDNNSWLDPERPTEDKLIGKELLHIPSGGMWLDQLTSPVAGGLVAFLLLVTGGTAAHTRRGRRRRPIVSQHAARPTGRRSFAGLPSWASTTATAAVVVGMLGAVLGFAAWTAPTAPVSTPGATAGGQRMVFSYTATVPRSPAYDDTSVTAPSPLFRTLIDTVDVQYTYTGAPGSIAVAVELSASSGWKSTLPLRVAEQFTVTRYAGAVTLDLDALERRAQQAAETTGIPAGDVTVAVVPTVTTTAGKFRPQLLLTLSDLKLSLNGDKSSLKVGQAVRATATPTSAAPTVGFAGREIPVSTGRWLSVVLLVGALVALGLAVVTAWTARPATEGAAIRLRHSHLLVEVQPVATPHGKPVVDVVDFTTLAKLAERLELPILHWIRGAVDTFVLQDQDIFYRYRTDEEPPAARTTQIQVDQPA